MACLVVGGGVGGGGVGAWGRGGACGGGRPPGLPRVARSWGVAGVAPSVVRIASRGPSGVLVARVLLGRPPSPPWVARVARLGGGRVAPRGTPSLWVVGWEVSSGAHAWG